MFTWPLQNLAASFVDKTCPKRSMSLKLHSQMHCQVVLRKHVLVTVTCLQSRHTRHKHVTLTEQTSYIDPKAK